MATIRKTFTDGSVLTAGDVNGALNPTTADHIPWAVASGAISCTASGNTAPSATAVTFPPGRFAAPPIVTLNADTTNLKLTMRAINRTASGFSIYLGNSDGTALSGAFNVAWTAVQMTPTSGAG